MLFNSLAYLIFLPIVVGLYWLMPFKFRPIFLLMASYAFYMFWKPVYILLILGLTVANYALGIVLERITGSKRLVLAIGIAINLLVLGFFKYAYFLNDSANSIAVLLHLPTLSPIAFDIILPLGISFFVFEFIHYLVDIHRGGKAVRSFINFALFPAFFPTQIAGPIKRYQDFIPQLLTARSLSISEFNQGIELIVFGLFKKVCLADNLSSIVGRCYAHPQILNGADLWLATYAFAFEIYFDFSGYTDIARGSAQLMGFKVPLNFKLPYLASSIADFWHRWHISLSSWLRDYLFIPMGGSRCSRIFNYRNLFITMVLGGLWHGAAMHFVIWGAFHGTLLVLHKEFQRITQAFGWWQNLIKTRAFHIFSILLTFHCACIGWVFFRASNMGVAWEVLQKLFFIKTNAVWWQPTILNTNGSILFAILPFALMLLWLAQILVSRLKETPGIMPEFTQLPGLKSIYLAVLIMILLVSCPDATPSFIYFQF